MTREEALQLREVIEKSVVSLDDETALQGVTLFPNWAVGVEYKVGERIKYDEVLYRALQDHTSQETWTPDISPSLFTKVLIPTDTKIYDWEQPNSTNSYMSGDKVVYDNQVWISTIDNNVWQPSVYGWEIYNE